jgi:hypothetical protein
MLPYCACKPFHASHLIEQAGFNDFKVQMYIYGLYETIEIMIRHAGHRSS